MKDKITATGDDLHFSTQEIYFAHWPMNGIGGGQHAVVSTVLRALPFQTFHVLGVRHTMHMRIPSMPRILAHSIPHRPTWLIFPIFNSSYLIALGYTLRSNCDVCSNWNALSATAEAKNKLLLQIKTALFTNLQYFFPLIKESIRMLAPSKARNRPKAWSSLNMHAARPLNRSCAVAVYFLDTTKIGVVYNDYIYYRRTSFNCVVYIIIAFVSF